MNTGLSWGAEALGVNDQDLPTVAFVLGLPEIEGDLFVEIGEPGIWLWRVVLAAVKADTHATWSWQDPRPALANVSAVLGKLWQFVGRSERADDSH